MAILDKALTDALERAADKLIAKLDGIIEVLDEIRDLLNHPQR